MKHINLINLSLSVLAAVNICSATTINFSAQIGNNLAGIGSTALAAGDLVEIGIFNTSTQTFTSIFSASNDNIGFGAGFFAHGVTLDSNALVNSQLAFRWSEVASGLSAIAYYDILTGSNATRVSSWSLKGGDGTSLDTNSNTVDIADLTDGVTFTSLDPAAVLINAEFSGSNLAGVPSFNVVPEPSSFALLAGVFGLAWVMVRRRV